MGSEDRRAAAGVTVKSGWASAVLVSGSRGSPRVLDACTVHLSDPALPESRQPYHHGTGTAREPGPGLSRLVEAVERFGGRSVTELIQQYRAAGHSLSAAGIVVGSLIDPEQIHNDHIRIHALEGRLFRRVIEDALTRSRLPCSIWRERDLYGVAAGILRQPEQAVRGVVAALGRGRTGPWRAEQKAAALAAWLVLVQPRPRAS